MHRKTACKLAAVAVLFNAPNVFSATTYSIQLDQTKFGHVDQNNVPAQGPGVAGANSCVPTSLANSFRWLQTTRPDVYDNANKIIPNGSTTQDVAIDLANNWLDTTNAAGTSGNSWIDDKRRYLENKAPGKTIYSGQYASYTGTNNFIQLQNPTFLALFNSLSLGADVEVGILPNAGGTGHALTLTSLHWIDADMDNQIDASENATMDYIDPAGGVNGVSGISQAAVGGIISTNYGAGYTIALQVSELAIPEPAALCLTIFCAIPLFTRRRAR